MDHNGNNTEYPRSLTNREREWIEWILPVDRPGYKKYREMIAGMFVVGDGRRGKGEFILGFKHDKPDFSAPLAPVAAYGSIETDFGKISITLRENLDDQISVEIVSHRMEDVPEEFEESRRWTYSTWKPGDTCPQCVNPIREVSMHGKDATRERYFLAICPNDKRLWVFEQLSGMNRLIPVTNFYNELMLHKNIRDPKIGLDANRLFTNLPEYSDADLTYAFFTYNKIKTKVHAGGMILPDKDEKPGFAGIVQKLFLKHSS